MSTYTPSPPVSICSSSSGSRSVEVGSPIVSNTRSAVMHKHEFPSCARRATPSPSAYISDEDLFGEAWDDYFPYLSEAPQPPRHAEAFLAQPLLPPVTRVSRRSSSCNEKIRRRDHKVNPKG
ncbi:hypothetical protein LTR91_009696 [Friedmanniomyces endolithicus]|uniref:Uncharacterized protein n=1 Tax=Friedmanniomyces endolithicus TaxID=329885 RepID=A0A4U0UNR4_9PEZI|nr:hypothetical protein LTS09_011738 [Friedmanniomyces endolithicus]KAK0268231.1 hypothetical protein LTR35_015651 [Friedmanniomyces endolithicus]KAK0272040.1 hypothetical protein LTS00_016376 [Friedmanniomyces endolithicus]KAK0305710.1 hypothetical protein LTR82_016646 [Friedmanniomyces endolithicus]KAK0311446.1 hypothetical protein LTR01_003442 [Friedmanniomyces endolithicus]